MDNCAGCHQVIANHPEYVVTHKQLINGEHKTATYVLHNDECFVLWSIEEMGTQACPLRHPHCEWA